MVSHSQTTSYTFFAFQALRFYPQLFHPFRSSSETRYDPLFLQHMCTICNMVIMRIAMHSFLWLTSQKPARAKAARLSMASRLFPSNVQAKSNDVCGVTIVVASAERPRQWCGPIDALRSSITPRLRLYVPRSSCVQSSERASPLQSLHVEWIVVRQPNDTTVTICPIRRSLRVKLA